MLNAEIFNENVPIGTPVIYQSVDGDPSTARETKTRSTAWELGHGAPVVKIEGQAGGVLLSHLTVCVSNPNQLEALMSEALYLEESVLVSLIETAWRDGFKAKAEGLNFPGDETEYAYEVAERVNRGPKFPCRIRVQALGCARTC